MNQEYFRKIVIDNGIRLTPQRMTILDVLTINQKHHLTVEEIYTQSKEMLPQIGIPTVYRTVTQLEKINILYKIVQGDCCKYQLISPEENSKHRHFICTKCNNIIDISPPLISILEEEIEEKYGVKIERQNIIYYGRCTCCLDTAEIRHRG